MPPTVSRWRALAGLVAALALLGPAPPVLAQGVGSLPPPVSPPPLQARAEPARGSSVLTRQRPDFAPRGARVGSMRLFPKVGLSTEYNTNIFATETGETADVLTRVTPELALESEWGRHFLRLRARAQAGFHAEEGDEDFLDAQVHAKGRVDINRGTRVHVDARYDRLHVARTNPDDRAGSEPTEYDRYWGTLALERDGRRISGLLQADVVGLSFDDTAATGGGRIDNSDQDRVETTLRARLGYEVTPGSVGYAALIYERNDYDTSVAGLVRDSDGWEARLGARFDLGGVTSGEVYAGYLTRDFDDASLSSIDGPTAGASILWNPSGLTSVRLGVDRSIRETVQAGSGGYIATGAELAVEHELRRNLLLEAKARFQADDWEGIAREEETFTVGAAATYLLTRRLQVGLRYDLALRDTTLANRDYEQHVFGIQGRFQF